MVEVISKDVGEVRDKFSGEFKKGVEEFNEDYIKLNLKILD